MFKYLKKRQLTITVLALVLFLFILASSVASTYFGLNSFLKKSFLNQLGMSPATLAPRNLDGQLVAKKFAGLRPVAIIIDNHFDSRPVVGLAAASIIYETIAEGGITRYLAIFDPKDLPEKIGPVRSARPYFIDFAKEWQAIFLHCGGSPAALKQLKAGAVDDLNEYSNANYFWRDKTKTTPYNLFTSNALINKAILNKKFATQADFSPWLFKEEPPLPERPVKAPDIEVPFLEPGYLVHYHYDRRENNYKRYLNNEPHRTAAGKLLVAKNIVVQHVDSKILDSLGRHWLQTTGGGEAELYQDGQKISGFWENKSGRTRFFNDAGAEARFNPGTIWVEVVFDIQPGT